MSIRKLTAFFGMLSFLVTSVQTVAYERTMACVDNVMDHTTNTSSDAVRSKIKLVCATELETLREVTPK